ncbi:MAG: hypothetical protein FD156_1611 [Nitrospirae bacterium]|nr:MAG: hypothetical protein FD156_1611 [Nitrospirota bacterium]
MGHLKEDELQQRAKDVFNNLILLNEESKISLPKLSSETEKWMILWTHVLEEFVIRSGPYPSGFANGFMKNIKIPDPRSPLAPKAANAVRTTSLPPGDYLFKYGKSEYLRQALNEKQIRISPASSYDDPSLNPAIRDKELELSICPSPSGFKMKAYDGKTGKYKGDIHPQNFVYTARSKTNYYVYCLSLSFTPRLFLDFDADACLVIRKPSEFEKIILSIFETKVRNWSGVRERIVYIDPLNCSMADIDVFSSKDFRYAYQREYRFIWLPPAPVQNLAHIFIEVPNIEEYCYLVDISET